MTAEKPPRAKRRLRREEDRAAAVAVAPLVVSQINCASAFGLPERRFRELVNERKLPHRREGKLVLVDAAVLRAALLAEQAVEEVEEQKPLSRLDALRCEAGLRVVGGSR